MRGYVGQRRPERSCLFRAGGGGGGRSGLYGLEKSLNCVEMKLAPRWNVISKDLVNDVHHLSGNRIGWLNAIEMWWISAMRVIRKDRTSVLVSSAQN